MKYVYMKKFLIIFGKRKINIILLIFSSIILFILICHLLCGCCKMSFLETFETVTGKKIDVKIKNNDEPNMKTNVSKENYNIMNQVSSNTGKKTDVKIKNNDEPNMKTNVSKENNNIMNQVSSNTVKKEGFIGLNKNYMNTGEVYASYPSNTLNTNNWMGPTLTGGNAELNKLNSYKNTPLPLQNDNMFMFSHTEFKPDCCKYGETYSNSMGCACMNLDSVKYLWQRGGNNVPLIQGSSI